MEEEGDGRDTNNYLKGSKEDGNEVGTSSLERIDPDI